MIPCGGNKFEVRKGVDDFKVVSRTEHALVECGGYQICLVTLLHVYLSWVSMRKIMYLSALGEIGICLLTVSI